MLVTRWDPFREMRSMNHFMHHRRPSFPAEPSAPGRWSIPVDIVRDDDHFTVRAGMPGVPAEDIDVSIDDGMLLIKAETKGED